MSSLQATRAGHPALGESAEAETSMLYELHGARVHSFCLGRLGDREEAADAVQDTYAKAWLALRDGCEVRQPLSWLLTIAGNVCTSRYRAKQSRPIETTLHDDAVATANHQSRAELAGLPTALRALPDEQRRAFVLRELRGCSYEEIGDDLGVSYASVAALLHRSRRAVAASLSGAGRRALVVVPVPQFVRSVFEGGAVTATVAATTVGVGLLAAPHLGILPSHSDPVPTPPARSAAAPIFGHDATSFPLLRLAGGLLGSREIGSGPSPPSLVIPAADQVVAVHAATPAYGGRFAIVAGGEDVVPSEPDAPIAPQLPPAAVVSQPSGATSDAGEAPTVADPRASASVPAAPKGNGRPASSGSQGNGQAYGQQGTPPGQVNGQQSNAGGQGNGLANGQQGTPPGQANGQQSNAGGQGNGLAIGQQGTPPGQVNGQQSNAGGQGNGLAIGQQGTPPGQSGQPADPGSQGNGPPIIPPGQSGTQNPTGGLQGNGPGTGGNGGGAPPTV